MKLIIDLPNKTIAHIRSDYGHKYFGCIGDEDKKIIMKAIYDGTPLEEALEKIKARLNHRANEHLDGDYYVRIKDINEVFDEELAELKGKQE